MTALLFTIYFLIACYFITKIKFVQQAGLSNRMLLLLFTSKIAACLAVALVNHYVYFHQTDNDSFNKLGMVEFHNLFHNPKLFFTDIFTSNYPDMGEYFGSEKSFWNDLRNNIILKVLGFCNILSRGNYSINSLFFNVAAFVGHIALYRVFKAIYPTKQPMLIVGCFLLPSLLYFSSSIQKDLVVFTALSIFCYCLFFSLQHFFSSKKTIFLLLSFLTILLMRNFIATILLPCAILYAISFTKKIALAKLYVGMLLLMVIGIIGLQLYAPSNNPLKIVVAKQQAFLNLGKAATDYRNNRLQPTVKSFVIAAPTAIRRSYLSPLPGEFGNLYLNILSVEMLVYFFLFLLAFFFPTAERFFHHPFILFGIFFTFLIFLFIGYITTNAGSLVRYRSIYYPFFIVPILCNIHWQRLGSFLKPTQKINQ